MSILKRFERTPRPPIERHPTYIVTVRMSGALKRRLDATLAQLNAGKGFERVSLNKFCIAALEEAIEQLIGPVEPAATTATITEEPSSASADT